MGRATLDPNWRPTLIGVDSSTFITPTEVGVNPTTHAMLVEGSFSGGGDGAIVDGVNSSIKATVFDLPNSNPLSTALVDANGDQITSFGGGIQYTEGDTDASITGTALMFETNEGTNTIGVVNDTNRLPIYGSVTANAGTNLNTSALALETGGNLATLAGKDFATQTTLALIKAKTDNLDVTLSGGSQQTKITDGTNVANTLKSDGTAAGQNAQLVGGTYLSVAFSSSTVQALTSVDVGNYRYVSVQIISAGTGGVANFQTSNDNSNFVACSLVRSGLNTGATETSLNSANIDYGVVPGRYFRLNITGISGGTLSGVMVFSTIPGTQHTSGATINGTVTGSIAHDGGATNTAPLLVGAYASAAAPSDVSADNDSVRVWALRNGQIVNQPAYAGVLASTGNGVSGTGVQRVTIASDSTGVVGLNTGTNSIGKISDITTSITPGTGATNLGKAEDAKHTSGDVGVMMLGVRNEDHTDFSGTDKDYVPIATDATGDVYVNVRHSLPAGTAAIGKLAANDGVDVGDITINNASGAGAVNIQDGGNTITVDGTVTANATLAAETTKVIGTVNISASQTVGLATGSNAIGKLAANSGVDIGDVDVTSIVPGTGATNLGKAEDAAHSSGDVGVMMLGVRAASPTERSAGPTDGDYEPLGTNEVGALWVTETSSANGGDSTATASTADGSTALTNGAQVIKASAGKLTGYYIYNPNTSAIYVNFYNTAAASVTVGTTNPLFNICIPASAAANLSGLKVAFSTAMSWSATTTGGGNGAPSTALEATCWYK